ncbi:amino acid permease [Aneurinibacillus tyrosinisolvens]|uniref:amino acid permease n=1 Tax=Aneurinibacillus tyrosinisolvens TaxID=1443435 RepID=UPI00063F5E92|nr:amino acid permease [Aneurinibacillus tyrosinisolvens]
MSTDKRELSRSLKARHIMMMALGGAIGAGMFKGSSTSIGMAGPGVLLDYMIGGIILLFVMKGLAEMAVQNPGAKTFRDLLEPLLGRFAGYFSGWMYFLNWVLVMAAETAAAALFLQYWFHDVPLWVLSLLVSVVITLVNLLHVNVYGETEFWLAGLKIAVLILFILLGGTILFTGYEHHPAVGFQHLTENGGFFPHGIQGLASAMLVVMFSFGGSEMIGMTLGETENPEKVLPRVARGVIMRILVFYVLPILIIVSLVPWNGLSGTESPFVTVFKAVGIPYAADIMNFVMLTAVLSATNTGMYAASRMLYSQALSGQAPKFLAFLSERRVPTRALLVSISFLYVGVIIAFFTKGKTFDYLMVIPGYTVLIIWILLAFAHVRSRMTHTGQGFPLGSFVAFLALIVIFIGVAVTSPLYGTLISVAAMLFVGVSYLFSRKRTSL